jgi:hypothetical protein
MMGKSAVSFAPPTFMPLSLALVALGAVAELTMHDDGFQYLLCAPGTPRAGHFDGDVSPRPAGVGFRAEGECYAWSSALPASH